MAGALGAYTALSGPTHTPSVARKLYLIAQAPATVSPHLNFQDQDTQHILRRKLTKENVMAAFKNDKRPSGSASQPLRPGKKAPGTGTRFQAALLRAFPGGIPRRSTPRAVRVAEVDEVFDSDDLLEQESRSIPDRGAPQSGPSAPEVVANVNFAEKTTFVENTSIVEDIPFVKEETQPSIKTTVPLAPEVPDTHPLGDVGPSLAAVTTTTNTAEQHQTSLDTECMVVEEILPTTERGFTLTERASPNVRAASEVTRGTSFSPSAHTQAVTRGSSAQLLSRRSPRPKRRIIKTLKAIEGSAKRINTVARPQLRLQTDTAPEQAASPAPEASPTPRISPAPNPSPAPIEVHTPTDHPMPDASASPVASSLSSGSPLSSAPPSPATPLFLSAPPSQAGTRDNEAEMESPVADCIIVKPLAYAYFFEKEVALPSQARLDAAAKNRTRRAEEEATFVGSAEEKEQLIALYLEHGGSFKMIRRKLRFSRDRGREDGYRLLDILREAAAEGRIQLLDIHKTRISNLGKRGVIGAAAKTETGEVD